MNIICTFAILINGSYKDIAVKGKTLLETRTNYYADFTENKSNQVKKVMLVGKNVCKPLK